MLPALVLLLVATLAGLQIARRLMFPILLVYTVIPIWDVLNPALQAITANVSSSLLEAFGIAVLINGNHITIPAGNFVVASGCSGLNYLLMCVFLALVYNHLYISRLKQQLIMFIAGVIVGMVCNWVRVTSIIAIGQITDMQSSMVRDHETLGLVVFGIFCIPLMLFGRHLETQSKSVKSSPTQTSSPSLRWLLWPSLVLIVTILFSQWHNNQPANFDQQVARLNLQKHFDKLALKPYSKTPWGPVIHNADLNLNFASSNGKLRIGMEIFVSEQQGKELIYDSNRLFKDTWQQQTQKIITSPSGQKIQALTLRHWQTGKKWQVLAWYQMGNSRAATSQWVKALQVKEAFLKNRDASLITLSRSCHDNNCQPWQANELSLADDIGLELISAINALTLSQK